MIVISHTLHSKFLSLCSYLPFPALHYVLLHKNSHLANSTATPDAVTGTAWKFNKARQNWLLRNFFDPSLVPEAYVDVVVGYLKTVQGRARSEIETKAKEVIEGPKEVVPGVAVATEEGDAGAEVADATVVDADTAAADTPDAEPVISNKRDREAASEVEVEGEGEGSESKKKKSKKEKKEKKSKKNKTEEVDAGEGKEVKDDE